MHPTLAIGFPESLEEVRRQAELVVVATVSNVRSGSRGQVPFSVAQLSIEHVLFGDSSLRNEIAVRYTGSADYAVVTDSLPAVPRVGDRYLLYLFPYTGETEGGSEWIVVGQGQWRQSLANSAVYQLDILDVTHSDLPFELSRP